MPSVAAQSFPDLEQVIVSDGPDPELAHYMKRPCLQREFRYLHTDVCGGHWGHEARLKGIAESDSEFIGWLDDDDAYRPEHVALMVAALEAHPEAGFAYGRMLIGAQFRWAQQYRDDLVQCLGDDVLTNNITTSMLFHRRSILQVATWGTGTLNPDRDLAHAWRDAGVGYVAVPKVSLDMYNHPAAELDPWEAPAP